MKIVIDVGYDNDKANIAAVSFENWTDEKPLDTKRVLLNNIATYEPGQFYKRELPCLEEILGHYDLKKTDTIHDFEHRIHNRFILHRLERSVLQYRYCKNSVTKSSTRHHNQFSKYNP